MSAPAAAADRSALELRVGLAVYALVVALLLATGFRMQIRSELLQFLPVDLLRGRLLESIWFLHAQPPILNLGLGAALRLEQLTGLAPEHSLAALNLATGAACVFFWCRLAARLVPRKGPRRVVLALLLLHPVFYTALFQWFYTLHEIFFLSAIAYAAARFLEVPDARRMAWLGVGLLGLALDRSLFHPIFAFGVLGSCLVLARSAREQRAARAVAAATVVLLLAWPIKNAALFDVFGYSSWRGFNFARGLELDGPEIHPLFEPGRRADAETRRAAQALVPEALADVAALTRLEKAPGVPNWNHYAMIAYSSEREAQALAHLLDHPGALFARAAHNYLRGYALHAGRNAYYGGFEQTRGSWVSLWMRGHEILLFQSFSSNPVSGLPTGFALLFPVALAWIAQGALRERNPFGVVPLWSIVWVLAMVLFVDGQEGNRMRLGSEPLFWLLLAGRGCGRR